MGMGLGAGAAVAQVLSNALKPPMGVSPGAPQPPTAAPVLIGVSDSAASEGFKFCIECGKPIPQRAKFCAECGKAQ